MTGKLLGSLLLLCGGGTVCLRWICAHRQAQRRLWALAAMLERMEGAIRWQRLPLPRVLEQEAEANLTGEYALAVCGWMQGGIALQDAWIKAFSALLPEEAAAILCRVELRGDARQITGALHLAAVQLRQLAADYATRQSQSERLCIAAGLSLSGLAVILLI